MANGPTNCDTTLISCNHCCAFNLTFDIAVAKLPWCTWESFTRDHPD